MSNEHPITPPPELFGQWEGMPRSLAFEAAYRAGADQQLERIIHWLVTGPYGASIVASAPSLVADLRAACRPKPLSDKEQSIALIKKIQANKEMWQIEELDVVLRALEALPDNS